MFFSLPFRAKGRDGRAEDAERLPTVPQDRWTQTPKPYASDPRVAGRLSPAHLMMLR